MTAGPTSGTVTVTENVPDGLTLAWMSGTGWNCPGGSNSCARSDPLAAGASYPPITMSVNVASDAPSSLTNQATISGGSSAPVNASDPTTVLPALAGPCTAGQSGSASVCNVQQTINEVLGLATGNGDLNQDGFVNVLDVQIAINAVLLGG
jgi:hypothetical protein